MTSETSDIVICRTCISECEKFKSLHKMGYFLGESTTLGALLSYFTDIEVSPDDSMPPYICLRCVQNLTSSFVFKRMVVEADEELRSQNNVTELKCQQQEVELCAQSNLLVGSNVEPYETEYAIGQKLKDCDLLFKHVKSFKDQIINETNDFSNGNEFVLPDFHEYYLSNASDENKNMKCPQTKDTSRLDITHNNKGLVCRSTRRRTKVFGAKRLNPDWQCKICSKQLSNQHSFKYHMQLHSDETPFLCSLCGEGFKTRNSYEGHLVIHDPNNPNTCRQCGKAYRQSSSLRTHMLTHTGEKPFRCDICGKGMTQKSGYKKHMLIHTGEKPHTCDICGRDFRYSSNLIAHKRSHSSEKPCKCQRCEKNFSSSEQMKRHKNIHITNNPFLCKICGKTFKRRSSIVVHQHIHKEIR